MATRSRPEPDSPGTYPAHRRIVHPGAFRRMVLEQARDIAKSARRAAQLAGDGKCQEAQRMLLWAMQEKGDIGSMLYECSREGCMTESAEMRLRQKLVKDVNEARYAVGDRCLHGRIDARPVRQRRR